MSPVYVTPSVPKALTDVATTVTDSVSLTNTPEQRKNYKALAWAGFGAQCVGAGLVLTGHGAVGVAVFAVGAAAIVYGEYKARQ